MMKGSKRVGKKEKDAAGRVAAAWTARQRTVQQLEGWGKSRLEVSNLAGRKGRDGGQPSGRSWWHLSALEAGVCSCKLMDRKGEKVGSAAAVNGLLEGCQKAGRKKGWSEGFLCSWTSNDEGRLGDGSKGGREGAAGGGGREDSSLLPSAACWQQQAVRNCQQQAAVQQQADLPFPAAGDDGWEGGVGSKCTAGVDSKGSKSCSKLCSKLQQNSKEKGSEGASWAGGRKSFWVGFCGGILSRIFGGFWVGFRREKVQQHEGKTWASRGGKMVDDGEGSKWLG